MVPRSQQQNIIIAIVGLGYVGLPLAVEFAKAGVKVIGFDINLIRIEELKRNFDKSNEVSEKELNKAPIQYSSSPKEIQKANFIIVAIPTPITKTNKPDLKLIKKASVIVGQNLAKNSIVVYESTVWPGLTEDICRPIIEKESGLKCGKDWFIGYSPERINPGDLDHTIAKITKVVSAMDKPTLNKIAEVYGIVCKAGIHKAPNIKTAEMAKVFENIQRDVNIALINELVLICHKLGIETQDVLTAANTKWNFLKFRPGLVGGHCVGVDPYYLVAKAKAIGYHPQIITAGRRINDYMPKFVAEQTADAIKTAGKKMKNIKILVMGLTFKENVRDIRNSKIIVTIANLKKLGANIYGYDPNLTAKEIIDNFGILPVQKLSKNYDAVIISVAHRQFFGLANKVLSIISKPPIIIDVTGIYRQDLKDKQGLIYKNL